MAEGKGGRCEGMLTIWAQAKGAPREGMLTNWQILKEKKKYCSLPFLQAENFKLVTNKTDLR